MNIRPRLRDLSLLLALPSRLLSGLVSRGATAIVYWFGIAPTGVLLLACGMNRLERDFDACRKKESMFTDCDPRADDSKRQS